MALLADNLKKYDVTTSIPFEILENNHIVNGYNKR